MGLRLLLQVVVVTSAVILTPDTWAEGKVIASNSQIPEKPLVQPAERESALVLVLGDSISAAYGINKSQGWVALLENKLHQQCPHIQVHNASVSGETTAGGLLRLPSLLARLKPALVVLELGGNDGLRGLSPAQMQQNFGKMIALTREANAEAVLLGMLIPPNYGEAYQRLFKQAIVHAAQKQEAPLLEFFLAGVAEHAELMQEDGIHPTAEAQATLLSNAMEILKPRLLPFCETLTLSSRPGVMASSSGG